MAPMGVLGGGGWCVIAPLRALFLLDPAPTASLNQSAPPSPTVEQVNFVQLSDASSTKLGALPSMWNKISILDKSGAGLCGAGVRVRFDSWRRCAPRLPAPRTLLLRSSRLLPSA